MASILVRGQAVVPAVPDDAELAVEISALRASAQDAFSDVAARSAVLDGLLDELSIEDEARSTQGVSVRPHWEYGEGGRREDLGYQATNRLAVRLSDREVLSRLIREAVERADARIGGPWWRVAARNPARQDACRQAAEDARRRAEAYAEALGMRLGAVVAAGEPGGRTDRDDHVSFSAIGYGPVVETSDIPIEPGTRLVGAALEVTFALEPRE